MPDRNAALIDYVSRLYPRPGVEPLLLRLQNEHDLDVLLLLAACWVAAAGPRLWQTGEPLLPGRLPGISR